MGGVEGWDVEVGLLVVAGLEVTVVSMLVEVLDVVLGSPVDVVLGLLVVGGLEVAGGSLVTEGL